MPERVHRILEERARALARPLAESAEHEDLLQTLTFTIGVERYAIELGYVREVVDAPKITPLPDVKGFVLGVFNLRGIIVPAINTGALLHAAAADRTRSDWAIVLGYKGPELSLLADRAEALVDIALEDLTPPPESLPGAGRAFLRGVSKPATAVLDGAALLDKLDLV